MPRLCGRMELWFDEFLYLWCDYIQPTSAHPGADHRCDLMNFCIFDVITYSASEDLTPKCALWFDEFLYLWCDYIQPPIQQRFGRNSCDLMNFCIFDVITYSLHLRATYDNYVVIWWIFVSLMWLHTAYFHHFLYIFPLWFDEFLYLWCDYIQPEALETVGRIVVIWWIFVSLMWLHTARRRRNRTTSSLWFDEFLYLWCDYIQQQDNTDGTPLRCDLMNFCIFDVITYSVVVYASTSSTLWFDEFLYLWCDYIQHVSYLHALFLCCDLMNFCIFDVITYSSAQKFIRSYAVVIWWIFVSLMWLHTAHELPVLGSTLLWFDEFLYLWCDYIQRRYTRW